jgi:hypothetical protein
MCQFDVMTDRLIHGLMQLDAEWLGDAVGRTKVRPTSPEEFPEALSPRVVLQRRHRIKRLLARGGMGAVYEAEAVHLRNATVAVKETFFGEDRQSLREQFEREAATLARLRHPALPQVKDHFIFSMPVGESQLLVYRVAHGRCGLPHCQES